MSTVIKKGRNPASDSEKKEFLKKLKLLTDMPISFDNQTEERADPTPNKNLMERLIDNYRQTLNLPEERLKINFLPTIEEISSEYKKRFPKSAEKLEKINAVSAGWTVPKNLGPSSAIEIVAPEGDEKTLWHELQHARDAATGETSTGNHFAGGKKYKAKNIFDQIRQQEIDRLNDELKEKQIIDEAIQKRLTGVTGDKAKELMYLGNYPIFEDMNTIQEDSTLLNRLINRYRFRHFKKWLYEHTGI